MEQSIEKRAMVRATVACFLRFAAAAVFSAAIVFLMIGGQDRVLMMTPFGVLFGINYGIQFGLYVGAPFSLLFWIKAYRKSFCSSRTCRFLTNHGAFLGTAVVLVWQLPAAVLYISHPVEFNAEYSPLLIWSTTVANFLAGLIGGYFSAPALRRAASINAAGKSTN